MTSIGSLLGTVTEALKPVAETAIQTIANRALDEVGTWFGEKIDAWREARIDSGPENIMQTIFPEASQLGTSVLARAETSGAALQEALNAAGVELPHLASTTVEPPQGMVHFDAKSWTEWRPQPDQLIKPSHLQERFAPFKDPSHLESYVRTLEQRDRGFAEEMKRRQEQLQEAKTRSPDDYEAASKQVTSTTAGKLGEAIAIDGLKPYFRDVEVQRRVETPGGRTFIDARFNDARNPIVLGHGRGVAKGDSLAIEVKTGKPDYLAREVPHITEDQVPGHLAVSDQSLVLVSREIHGMSGERTMRDKIADSDSYVMALLPEKRQMDDVLLQILRERVERKSGGEANPASL